MSIRKKNHEGRKGKMQGGKEKTLLWGKAVGGDALQHSRGGEDRMGDGDAKKQIFQGITVGGLPRRERNVSHLSSHISEPHRNSPKLNWR